MIRCSYSCSCQVTEGRKKDLTNPNQTLQSDQENLTSKLPKQWINPHNELVVEMKQQDTKKNKTVVLLRSSFYSNQSENTTKLHANNLCSENILSPPTGHNWMPSLFEPGSERGFFLLKGSPSFPLQLSVVRLLWFLLYYCRVFSSSFYHQKLLSEV